MALTYEQLPSAIKARVDLEVAALRTADPGLPVEIARTRVVTAWATVTVRPPKGH